jgi:hypothetical protein
MVRMLGGGGMIGGFDCVVLEVLLWFLRSGDAEDEGTRSGERRARMWGVRCMIATLSEVRPLAG